MLGTVGTFKVAMVLVGKVVRCIFVKKRPEVVFVAVLSSVKKKPSCSLWDPTQSHQATAEIPSHPPVITDPVIRIVMTVRGCQRMEEYPIFAPNMGWKANRVNGIT